MKRFVWIVLVSLALVSSLPAAAAQGKGKGKSKSEAKGASAQKSAKGKAKKERKEDQERERQAAEGRAFGKNQEKKIREWFSNKKNLKGLPPGLAKREELPPGLRRHLERNGTLPPGLQKKVQPLPKELEAELPKTSDDVRRVVVAGNVILLEKRTSKILDIIQDVAFGGSGDSDRSSTGVERVRN